MLLESLRLRVRPLNASDAAALWAVLGDAEVMRYIEPPYSLERTQGFIQEAGSAEIPLVYAVELKATGSLIGHLIFHPLDLPKVYELGWVLGKAYWGQGLASELTAACINHARAMGLDALVVECLPEQAASAAIAKRFGFVFSGQAEGLDQYWLDLETNP